MKFSLPISIIIAFFFMVNEKTASVTASISNFFFVIGFIQLFIGLAIIVKNGGLFKGFSYFLYKKNIRNRKHMEHSDDPELQKPMSIYEFTEARYSKRTKYVHFILVGIAGLTFAQIFAII